jgi:hypothetical protein
MLDDLVRTVPMAHFNFGNIGGAAWSKLKIEENSFPPWEKLKEAIFWKDAVRYQRVWDVLAGKMKKPTAAVQPSVGGDQGSVEVISVDMQVGGNEVTKIAAYGSLEALANHRKLHFFYVEAAHEGLPTGFVDVLHYHTDASIIIMGVQQGVYKALVQLNEYRKEYQQVWEWKTSLVHIFLKEDPPLGARQPPHINVHRLVLIASPSPLRNHRCCVVVDYPWRVCVLKHLLSIIDIPDKGVFHSLLYVPCSTRTDKDVLSRMGQVMAQIENLQVSWVQRSDTSALETSSTFKSICTAAYAGIDQAKYETMVLAKGNALNTWSITPPATSLQKSPRKSGGEELTQMSEGNSQLFRTAEPVPNPSPAKSAGKSTPKRAPRSASSGDQSVSSLQERSESSRMRERAEAQEQAAVSSAKSSARKARSASEAEARGSGSGSAKKKAKKSAEGTLNLQDFPTE